MRALFAAAVVALAPLACVTTQSDGSGALQPGAHGLAPAPDLPVPTALAGGATHREPVAISCLGFGVPGIYDVDVELLARERTVPLGRIRIDVANHPSLIAPRP